MDSDLRIFVVDDDPVILDVLSTLLGERWEVETFPSAEACLERTAVCLPQLFILDITLAGMDGLSLCRHFKDDWETQDIPVIFVSASDDMETRLSGYEAGGSDFIVKPFEPEELFHKVEVAARMVAERQALKEQAGYAQRTALSAMTSMSELGVVVQFLSRSFACTTQRELGDTLLQTLGQYELSGAVQLRLGAQVLSLSPKGLDVPLEVSVLNHVSQAGRIFQFSNRCVFNYGQVTVLINNMPVADEERCGRIRDNVAILAEGADARLRAIEVEQSNRRRQDGVVRALPQVHDALELVQANYRRNCFELTQHMVEFEERLLKSYVHLGLTESQEDFISSQVGEFMKTMVGTQDQSLDIVAQLEGLVKTLEGLARE